MAGITLPISMEDEDLFPRSGFGLNDHVKFDIGTFNQQYLRLDRIWWSRLVTGCRGYVVNAFKHDDNLIFLFDDSFIYLHRCLAEGSKESASEILQDIEVLEAEGTDGLFSLEKGDRLVDSVNPFFKAKTKASFCRLFGPPGPDIYERSFKQGFCFLVFFNVFCKLQQRWQNKMQKGRKSVKFSEDTEWQPDHRVVIFQEFAPGNRTWVLTDYDRHIIYCWRPNGVKLIFGDRYVQTKIEEGFKLCAYCGLLESQPGEFRAGVATKSPAFYCSLGCQQLHAPQHH